MSDKPKKKKSIKKTETKSSIKKSETKSSKKGKESSKSKEKKSGTKSKNSISPPPSILDNKTTSSKIEDDQNKLKENLSGNNNQLLSNQNKINKYIIPNNNINNNINIEKCEGCYQGEGYFYCTNCNKVYCKICDDQLHIIPSFRNHERILIENFSNLNMKCYHHNLPLRFFCESCQEPICFNCKNLGPHNNPLHHVGSVFEIYRKYLDSCKFQIEKNLVTKNEKIENILLNIDSLSKENKQTANIILKGINNEFDTEKQIISTKFNQLQEELNQKIDDIGFDIGNSMALDEYNNQSSINNDQIEKMSNISFDFNDDIAFNNENNVLAKVSDNPPRLFEDNNGNQKIMTFDEWLKENPSNFEDDPLFVNIEDDINDKYAEKSDTDEQDWLF